MAIRSVLFSAKAQDDEIELDERLVRDLVDETLLWVDVDDADAEQLRHVAELLQLPDDSVHGMLEGSDRAALERFPEALRLRLVAVGSGARGDRVRAQTIDIVAARNRVLTVHEGPVEEFDRFLESIHGPTRLGLLHAAGFVSALVDSVLAGYLRVVEVIERRVDSLDEQALKTADPEVFLREVVDLRRQVARLRRALAPLRPAIAPLGRPDLEIPGLGEPWTGLPDRLERVIDTVENARELLIGSFDVFMARHAERTNDIMKALTILNAVLLPAVVVAGVMGMNFRLGFFDAPGNFWLVLGAMVVLAAGIIGFSRWRGWI